ncbi:MAG: cobalamin biosynthesis protein CbiG [Pseudomonadota bacterium]
MALFDIHIMVDWSAASSPSLGADSIWVAALGREGMEIENLPTRTAAEGWLTARFGAAIAAGDRVLAGFDFPFGYPKGAAERMAAPGQPRDWRGVWARLADGIQEGPRNRNNRFALAAALNAGFGPGEGPFWGCPATAVAPTLGPRKPALLRDGLVPERRLADARVRAVSSCWQLAYIGSVGSQALTGIAMLERLRRGALGRHLAVWPFETGLTAAPEGRIVLAEVYPSLIAKAVAKARQPGEIKDCAQVRLLATALSTLDRQGTLGPLFAGPPDGLSAAEAHVATTEEAWILGAGWAAEVAAASTGP